MGKGKEHKSSVYQTVLTWGNLGHADEVWVGVKNPLSHSSLPPLPSSLVFHFQEEFFLLPHFSPFRPYLVLTYPQPSIIAYAACCQLDSEDRPLAGTIVYCAQHLTSPSLSHSDIIMVTAARWMTNWGRWGSL